MKKLEILLIVIFSNIAAFCVGVIFAPITTLWNNTIGVNRRSYYCRKPTYYRPYSSFNKDLEEDDYE